MPRNSFVQMSKLHNVRGRIYYISSDKKQENLYAVYETTDRKFWTELAKCNQAEFKKSGTEGKCIEAREFIIALPESCVDYPPDGLLKYMTDKFKSRYGVDCIAALHHNKRKTNYHIHLIFAERNYLDEPIEKIATRNMFYDEKGNHVRTKKEILDENGTIRKRCKVIKKGEVYERQMFTIKDARFKQEHFLDEVKVFYTDVINGLVKDEKEKLSAFKRGDVYLATKKIGKNNPKADKITLNNKVIQDWNRTVDHALVSGMERKEILKVKQEQISTPIKESIHKYGNHPELLFMIIFRAIELLKELIKLLIQKQEQQKARISDLMERRNEKQEKQPAPSVTQTDNQTIPAVTQPFKAPATTTAEKTVIPPRPRMSELAHDYEMRLEEIMEKLKRQNRAIHTQEVKKDLIDEDLKNCTGLFQGKKRKELQAQSNKYAETIKIMKQGLSHIVQDYKYPTVDAFLQVYKQGKSEYESYVKANKEWNSKYGENSIHRKLAEKQAEVQKREQDRDFNYRSPSDRGAR